MRTGLAALLLLASAASNAGAALTPQKIPLTDPEIANPQRGGYPSWDDFKGPAGWPLLDSYKRYEWKDLEPSRDQYSFADIDNELAKAQARGGKFGFRVQAANSFIDSSLPSYLRDLMPAGFTFTHPDSGQRTYAPDWNDPDFNDRARKLLQALGQRYDNDPRLGWVEVGFYGDWSEWHVWQFPYSGTPFGPSPTGATDITSANKRALIDMHVQAFPSKRIVMMTDNDEGLSYALQTYPAMGWRRDCLGYDIMDYLKDKAAWSLAQNRWRTAPVITESCTMRTGTGDFDRALRQVGEYHVSMVSGHNIQSYGALTAAEQNTLQRVYKTAGYRLALSSVSIQGPVQSGAPFALTAVWVNDGAAPSYMPWDVYFQFREPSTKAVVWEGKSGVDLRTLLPGAPLTRTDAFTPSGLGGANYDVAVIVRDPSSYYKPLALAIAGRAADGSHPLGALSGAVDSSTPPVVTAVWIATAQPTGLTVAWTTDLASDSLVEFGTSPSLGRVSALSTALATSHQVVLTGLGVNGPVYYRVRSRSAAGAAGFSDVRAHNNHPAFVAARGQDLYLDGRVFKALGVNRYNLASRGGGIANGCGASFSDAELIAWFAEIQQMGAAAVRFWLFQNSTSGGTDFARFDRLLELAAGHGVKVIPVLEDHWGGCSQSAEKDGAWYGGGYLAPYGSYAVSYKEYARRVVSRYKDIPTVLAWQLMNEAESKNAAGAVDPQPLYDFARDMSAYVKSLDPNHLVSLGTIGGGQPGTAGSLYRRLHALGGVDVLEYHDYDPLLAAPPNLVARFGDSDVLKKPVLVGEAGIKKTCVNPGDTDCYPLDQRAALFDAKLDDFFGRGGDASLIWSYRDRVVTAGDIYAFDLADPLAGVFAGHAGSPGAPDRLAPQSPRGLKRRP